VNDAKQKKLEMLEHTPRRAVLWPYGKVVCTHIVCIPHLQHVNTYYQGKQMEGNVGASSEPYIHNHFNFNVYIPHKIQRISHLKQKRKKDQIQQSQERFLLGSQTFFNFFRG
jgi:hypothetical protein